MRKLLFIFLISVCFIQKQNAEEIYTKGNFVYDYANVLSDEERSFLEERLRSFNQTTSKKLTVLLGSEEKRSSIVDYLKKQSGIKQNTLYLFIPISDINKTTLYYNGKRVRPSSTSNDETTTLSYTGNLFTAQEKMVQYIEQSSYYEGIGLFIDTLLFLENDYAPIMAAYNKILSSGDRIYMYDLFQKRVSLMSELINAPLISYLETKRPITEDEIAVFNTFNAAGKNIERYFQSLSPQNTYWWKDVSTLNKSLTQSFNKYLDMIDEYPEIKEDTTTRLVLKELGTIDSKFETTAKNLNAKVATYNSLIEPYESDEFLSWYGLEKKNTIDINQQEE